ncbi:MAG TPA: hypothetical protein VE871_02665, partial [Longimicrobium sp.]|nr:hypothetical protein [Longimicrobium sp.]
MTISRNARIAAFLLLLAAARVPAVSAQAPRVPSLDELMQPGVSLELARHRASTLSDVRYLLELDVTAEDSAPGRVTATFQRADAAGDLVLDFRGPSLGALTVNGQAVA